jgi:hypothetical protein
MLSSSPDWIVEEPNMSKLRAYKIVEIPRPKNELSQFARWFHQDWKLEFENFHEGATMYFESLTPERKKLLRSELSEFLEAHPGQSGKGLKRSWLRLGAAGWQRDLDIRDTLGQFVKML